jgi:multidrug efflux pump subunit AcrA (membrane-fusion protein)
LSSVKEHVRISDFRSLFAKYPHNFFTISILFLYIQSLYFWRTNTIFKEISMPKFLSKLSKRTWWIILAVAVLAGAGGFTYYRMFHNNPIEQTDENELQTATVRSGDLVIYASGYGTLVTAAEASFGFGTSRQVKGILVSVGDVVEAGQLLAELDNTTQELEYIQAKRELAELTSPYAIAAEQAVAEAAVEVDSTHSNLAYVISPSVLHWEEEVAKLEADSSMDEINLPVGASAAVEIISARAENALLVPVEALQETSPGKYSVYVVENDDPVLRAIEVGLKDQIYAEVKSGLEPGETVVTGSVTVNNSKLLAIFKEI